MLIEPLTRCHGEYSEMICRLSMKIKSNQWFDQPSNEKGKEFFQLSLGSQRTKLSNMGNSMIKVKRVFL